MSLTIALFTYSTKPRGSVIHTLELAEALHHLGHQVCVYALDKENQGFDYPLSCSYQPVPARPAPTDLDRLIQQRIQEFVTALSAETRSFDCYHAQDCISANALAILTQHQRIPHFVRTVHHIESYPSPYLRECQDRSIRAAHLCLSVSDRTEADLQQQYQIHAPRVFNGVNLRRFSPILNGREAELKHRWGLTGGPIYLTVGGIEPRKNSLRLLHAFAQIRSQIPQAQLVIAGGASVFDYAAYRQEFFALADELQLELGRSLILTGVVAEAELSALYRIADAFVFPSLMEGWGLVILEAIASGLPVITSNQPPFTEFLTRAQALLVDPESPDAIAEAMRAILQPSLFHTLVQQSQSVLSQYTWSASAIAHVHHYQTLLPTQSPAHA